MRRPVLPLAVAVSAALVLLAGCGALGSGKGHHLPPALSDAAQAAREGQERLSQADFVFSSMVETEAMAFEQVSMITPCSQYNDQHSLGNGNCLECTRLYFDNSVLRKNDKVMAQERNGDWYPLQAPVVPLLDNPPGAPGMRTCKWCPERQLCGHPDDYRTWCKPVRPDGAFAGWLTHKECQDTEMSTLDRYGDEEKKYVEEMRRATPIERVQRESVEAKRSNMTIDTSVRETAYLHDLDSEFDCFGLCTTKGGVSMCSEQITKVLPSSADAALAAYKTSLVGVDVNATPVPCKLHVRTDAVTPYRVYGRYKVSNKNWLKCELIPCRTTPDGA